MLSIPEIYNFISNCESYPKVASALPYYKWSDRTADLSELMGIKEVFNWVFRITPTAQPPTKSVENIFANYNIGKFTNIGLARASGSSYYSHPDSLDYALNIIHRMTSCEAKINDNMHHAFEQLEKKAYDKWIDHLSQNYSMIEYLFTNYKFNVKDDVLDKYETEAQKYLNINCITEKNTINLYELINKQCNAAGGAFLRLPKYLLIKISNFNKRVEGIKGGTFRKLLKNIDVTGVNNLMYNKYGHYKISYSAIAARTEKELIIINEGNDDKDHCVFSGTSIQRYAEKDYYITGETIQFLIYKRIEKDV